MPTVASPYENRWINVKNRTVIAPMTTYSSKPNGDIQDDELPYLERRARGGFGMIMTAACYVHDSGHAFRGQWGCSDDRFMPSLTSAAEAINRGGSMSVLQIHHGGRQCPADLVGGDPISASAIPAEREGAVTPREMTDAEVLRTIRDFADAAVRAKQAGFHGVEIHGANTYLIQQFVSPHSNRRTDYWAADTFNFPRELTQAVLEAVGPDYPVGYRFSPEENETPGIRMDRTEALLNVLCQLSLAWLHISLRTFDQPSAHDKESTPLLSRVAKIINGRTALIGVGGVKTPADADACLALGADLVAIGRVAVSEPEWVLKMDAPGTIKTKLPKGDFAESLTVPRGLTDKILAVPGWFEIDSD